MTHQRLRTGSAARRARAHLVGLGASLLAGDVLVILAGWAHLGPAEGNLVVSWALARGVGLEVLLILAAAQGALLLPAAHLAVRYSGLRWARLPFLALAAAHLVGLATWLLLPLAHSWAPAAVEPLFWLIIVAAALGCETVTIRILKEVSLVFTIKRNGSPGVVVTAAQLPLIVEQAARGLTRPGEQLVIEVAAPATDPGTRELPADGQAR